METIALRAADLRLPPEREDGSDPFKLADQIRQFGDAVEGMPAIQVTRGRDSQHVINDGVTRAARAYWLNPAATVRAEVIAETDWDFSGLPTLREVMIPR